MIEIKSNADTAQELAASLKVVEMHFRELHQLQKMNKPNYLVMMRPIKPLILLKPKQKKLQRRLNQSGPTCKVFQLDLQKWMKRLLRAFNSLKE